MWEYREQSGYDETFAAAGEDDALRHARELLRDGDWGTPPQTIWVEASVRQLPEPGDGPGEYPAVTVTVQLDPAEPPCADGTRHYWEHAGTRGHGGGVIITAACGRCDKRRETDTRAQVPPTGAPADRNAIRYLPAAGTEDHDA